MLTEEINAFKRQYGDAPVEHFRVIKDGKIIGEKVGQGSSVETWNNIQDCDVIHNHPAGNPAFSEMDIIMTIYGNANSVTAVSGHRGSWTMVRPAGGWKDIDHRVVESEYKKARNKEKKSAATKELINKIRNNKLSMIDGEGIFAERYATAAIRNIGLHVRRTT
jgi:hypothetical protein